MNTALTYVDDAPVHPLLSRHMTPPRVETSATKTIAAPIATVFEHFFGSEPHLRLELHKDHVKQYHIHRETETTLEYEFVFEAYGTRNYGKAVEVAQRNPGGAWRIDVEVKEGPLAGQTIVTHFREVAGGTEVEQVNRIWPGPSDLMVRMLGNKLKARLVALAGVHLEQHRHDLEGLERFEDRFSQEHQTRLAARRTHPALDLLKTTRAITLPIILLPVLAGAALAGRQGVFDPLALVLGLLGAAAALLAANLINDLFDFRLGADQSARNIPGAIETGSGAFVEGRWSLRKGWAVTAVLAAVALGCGAALAVTAGPAVLAFAVAGALIAYAYVGPPFPLAYKGRGLGEVSIFVAFGLLPVLGGVLSHGGALGTTEWVTACLFGLTSVLVLYHHHFLHWQADLAAGKGSPVALLGPCRGARLGLVIALSTSAAVTGAVVAGAIPIWALSAAAPPLLLVRPHRKAMAGETGPPLMVDIAKAGFGAMLLSGVSLVVTLWLA